MTTHRQSMSNAPILVDDDTGLAVFTVTSAGGPTNTVGEVSDETGNVLAIKKAQVTVVGGGVGQHVIVAAVPTKKIRVLSYLVGLSTPVDMQFVETGGTPVGAKGYAVIGGEEKAGNGDYVFETVAGQGLDLWVSTTTNLSVQLSYVEV